MAFGTEEILGNILMQGGLDNLLLAMGMLVDSNDAFCHFTHKRYEVSQGVWGSNAPPQKTKKAGRCGAGD